jgi:hypothetical protein
MEIDLAHVAPLTPNGGEKAIVWNAVKARYREGVILDKPNQGAVSHLTTLLPQKTLA